MKKRDSIFFIFLVLAVAVAVIIIFQSQASIDIPTIIVPSATPSPQGDVGPSENIPLGVDISTVQDIIASIERPDSYSRTYRVTTYSSAGEAAAEISIFCKGGKYRIIHSQNDIVKNTLFSDGMMYIWYGSSSVYSSVKKELTDGALDESSRLIFFQELLTLPQKDILAAEDEIFLNESCIYVEYRHSEKYIYKLHISVKNGLLVAAEVLEDGKPVYMLESELPDISVPSDDMFTLPS